MYVGGLIILCIFYIMEEVSGLEANKITFLFYDHLQSVWFRELTHFKWDDTS